jgi:hypothetical protein
MQIIRSINTITIAITIAIAIIIAVVTTDAIRSEWIAYTTRHGAGQRDDQRPISS